MCSNCLHMDPLICCCRLVYIHCCQVWIVFVPVYLAMGAAVPDAAMPATAEAASLPEPEAAVLLMSAPVVKFSRSSLPLLSSASTPTPSVCLAWLGFGHMLGYLPDATHSCPQAAIALQHLEAGWTSLQSSGACQATQYTRLVPCHMH